jgi:HK97 family phage prohead protease
VERRDFNLKIKSVDDQGTFVGLGAVYNNVDLGGDLIEPGAFNRTLSAGKKFPVLWQHDPSNPIGSCSVTDTPSGLQVNGTLELSDPTAKKAHTFLKSGVIRGLSIGYDTIQSSYSGDVRHLTELKLWEISCVTFPMNESAQVTGVKSLSDQDTAKHLTAIREHSKSIDHHQRAIRMHLKSMMDDDDTTDDVLDDPSIFEDNGDDDGIDDEFLKELQLIVAQAQELETK